MAKREHEVEGNAGGYRDPNGREGDNHVRNLFGRKFALSAAYKFR